MPTVDEVTGIPLAAQQVIDAAASGRSKPKDDTVAASSADIPTLDQTPDQVPVPEHVHGAICELIQKRDSIAQEVKRLESICDGLIKDVATRNNCPLEQYSYNLQTGVLERIK